MESVFESNQVDRGAQTPNAIHPELYCCWHQGPERGQHTSADLEGHSALSPASGEEPKGPRQQSLNAK